MKTLGIISGMGALAGMRLAQYLLETATARGARLDSDFPAFLLYNLPAKGTDEHGIIDESLVISQLKSSLAKMEDWGCVQVIIACNSAHIFFDELQSGFSGEIINMIDAACQMASSDKVGVLCSDSTRKSKLYEKRLTALGMEAVSATDAEQLALNAAVRSAMSGHSKPGNMADVESIILRMSRAGAEEIIVGCTEIPLVLDGRIAMRLIDSGQEAVNFAIKNG